MLSREGNRFSPILMKQGATFSEEEWQEQMEKLESEERFKIKKMSNSSESESEETESDDDNQETESVKECALESENDEINNDESSNTGNEISENNEIENQNLQVLTAQELEKYQEKISKSGVCYMSRIPPFMKPSKLRALLTKYGEIGRIYLNPEDFKVSERRRKYKKNKRINYVEGWIEFADKRVSSAARETLISICRLLGKWPDCSTITTWAVKKDLIIMMIYGISSICLNSSGTT